MRDDLYHAGKLFAMSMIWSKRESNNVTNLFGGKMLLVRRIPPIAKPVWPFTVVIQMFRGMTTTNEL